MEYLHAQAIIHADLTPNNILLTCPLSDEGRRPDDPRPFRAKVRRSVQGWPRLPFTATGQLRGRCVVSCLCCLASAAALRAMARQQSLGTWHPLYMQVSDFGLSKIVLGSEAIRTRTCGTSARGQACSLGWGGEQARCAAGTLLLAELARRWLGCSYTAWPTLPPSFGSHAHACRADPRRAAQQGS